MNVFSVVAWRRGLVAIGTTIAFGATALAAEPRDPQIDIRDLKQRVDRLEKRNAELERALDSDQPSERDLPLATRLKAIEEQAAAQKSSASKLDAFDGIKVDVSFTTVGQRANADATVNGGSESQLNYRADIAVSLPVGSIGSGTGELSAQLRAGQGDGLARLRSTFSGSNATAFQLSGSSQADDSTALLAQLWYQAEIPIEGSDNQSHSQWQLGFGKTEVFQFFDQNATAGDEARQFINSAFVHNPLLDAGGDVGADVYGFQPGIRLGYTNETDKPLTCGLSIGIFGAGTGARFQNTFRSPFSIVQAETHQRFFGGLDGNYRLYLWRNGQATPYNNSVDSSVEKHAGWGVSVDQRVSEAVTLFARYGKETRGRVQFDRAITAGAEIGGEFWRRAQDAVGMAIGSLRTSAQFQVDAPTLDANGDSTPDFGYAPSDSEKVYELYYRYQISKTFALTPDFQLIQNPGGNDAATNMKIFGLRVQVNF